MGGDDRSKQGGVQGEEEGSKDGALWDTSGELTILNGITILSYLSSNPFTTLSSDMIW